MTSLDDRAPEHDIGPASVRSRLAVLAFPPAFFSAMNVSPLGTLPDLWQRLGPNSREELHDYSRTWTAAHHHELRDEIESAAQIHRLLSHRHPQFRPVAHQSLLALGLVPDEAAAEVAE